jgi:hypothetical protein
MVRRERVYFWDGRGRSSGYLLACPMRWGQRMTRGHHNRVGCVLFAVRAIGSHLFLVAVAPPLGSIIHLGWQQFYTAFWCRLQNFCFNPHAVQQICPPQKVQGPGDRYLQNTKISCALFWNGFCSSDRSQYSESMLWDLEVTSKLIMEEQRLSSGCGWWGGGWIIYAADPMYL